MAARTRRDAAENDERVLAAAVTTMLRAGRDVPMSVIAAQAGVGVATLYRRYANRDELLQALTERSLALLIEAADRLLAEQHDGLTMVSRYWDYVLDHDDQLVLPLRGGPAPSLPASTKLKRELNERLREIVRVGHDDGSLHADAEVGDIVFFGTMLATPFPGTRDARRIARRQKDIHLRGLRGPSVPADAR